MRVCLDSRLLISPLVKSVGDTTRYVHDDVDLGYHWNQISNEMYELSSSIFTFRRRNFVRRNIWFSITENRFHMYSRRQLFARLRISHIVWTNFVDAIYKIWPATLEFVYVFSRLSYSQRKSLQCYSIKDATHKRPPPKEHEQNIDNRRRITHFVFIFIYKVLTLSFDTKKVEKLFDLLWNSINEYDAPLICIWALTERYLYADVRNLNLLYTYIILSCINNSKEI